MSAQHLFGTPEQQATLGEEVDARTETVQDGVAPIVLASIMYCPALIGLSVGLSC